MKSILVTFSVCSLAIASSAIAAPKQFEVTSGPMTFKWSIEGNNLRGTVRAKTTGWVAVGFNPSKGMKDAMFVLGAEKDGKVKVENHFGTSERAHESYASLGCKETLTNTTGKLDGEYTEISFTIPTNASDKCSKPLNLNGDTKLLMAHGSGKKFSFGHPFKVALTVNLATGAKK